MTSSVSTAKAASDRERAIGRAVKRMAVAIAGVGNEPARQMIGRPVTDRWRLVATDGHAAILEAAEGLPGPYKPLLRDALAGPTMPIPAAFGPVLKRVSTCSPKPLAGALPCVRIQPDGERLTLEAIDAREACEAREWMPADCGDLAGRCIAVDPRLLKEAIAVVGLEGRMGLCKVADVHRPNLRTVDGRTYEWGPLALVSADRLWAVVLMGMFLPGTKGGKVGGR